MTNRIELCILNTHSLEQFKTLYNTYNIVNIYIKTNIENLSAMRKELINLNYTTRLFVLFDGHKKQEYIYGKLKGQKGVFNEHCKNSVFRKPIEDLIDISSNIHDTVLTDDENLHSNYKGSERTWIIL
jgi:hypothetical protein